MRELKPTKTNPELPARSRRVFEPAFPALGGGLFDFSPFRFISAISEEMDKMMRGNGSKEPEFWAPPVEVTELEGKLLITAELPGLKKDEVKVEVVDGALIIEGERKHETEEKKEGYFRTERTYGHFFRSIPLPETAKTNEIKAELKNGILEVAIPVSEVKPNRQTIPVHEGPKAAITTTA
jgi:HSP20 family protein